MMGGGVAPQRRRRIENGAIAFCHNDADETPEFLTIRFVPL
jgi:hypothetical protein